MPHLLIGNDTSDFLRIEPTRRMYPTRQDYWDGNWLSCAIVLVARAFRARVDASLRTTDFIGLRHALQAMNASLKGEARLETMEKWITLSFRADGRGHISVSGELVDDPGVGNVLRFTLPALDQTHLPPLLDALDEILLAYPTLGAPDAAH